MTTINEELYKADTVILTNLKSDTLRVANIYLNFSIDAYKTLNHEI